MGEGARDNAVRARRHDVSVAVAGERAGGRKALLFIHVRRTLSKDTLQGPLSWDGWRSSWVGFTPT